MWKNWARLKFNSTFYCVCCFVHYVGLYVDKQCNYSEKNVDIYDCATKTVSKEKILFKQGQYLNRGRCYKTCSLKNLVKVGINIASLL
jgi:hypothetical protein